MTELYITPRELIRAVTGLGDWKSVFGPSSVDEGLANLCHEVSGLIDNAVGGEVFGNANRPYVLRATEDTEEAVTTNRLRALVDRHGNLNFRTTYRPIRKILAYEYAGLSGGTYTSIDLSRVYVDDRDVIAPGVWLSPLPLRVRVRYVNGYPNALLTADVEANATSLPVEDPTGFLPGEVVTIYDGIPEVVRVASNYAGGSPITLAAPLSAGHDQGTRVSAMQIDVRKAAIYFALDTVQTKGLMGFVSGTIQFDGESIHPPFVNFRKRALELLARYVQTP